MGHMTLEHATTFWVRTRKRYSALSASICLGRLAEGRLTVLPNQAMDVCGWRAMHVRTKFLRVCKPLSLGDRIDDW